MMAESKPNVTLTDAWVDLMAGPLSAFSGQRVRIQNVSSSFAEVRIVWGGASAPTGINQGFKLTHGQADEGTSDHVWVRGVGSAEVAIGQVD